MNKRLLLCFALALGTVQAAPASLPAGTVLKNQASGDAILTTGPIQSVSNVVSTVVIPVCNVSVTPNGSATAPAYSSSLLPGETTSFLYTIRNVGNDTFTIPLTAQNLGSTQPQLSLYQDSNNNGTLDSTDAQVSSVELAAGATAKVFLQASTTQADRDNALVNLVAQCQGGASDNDNISQIVIGPPPVLGLTKTFSNTVLKPGDTTTVTVMLSNTGASGSREVVVSDSLITQVNNGLLYQPGSAAVSAGTLEYSSDGSTWTTTEPSAVEHVRLRLGSVAPAGEIRLTFRMKADPSAEGRTFINTADLTSTVGGGAQASATLSVRYQPAVAIGPAGNPTATDGADSQTVAFALANQETCFDHTVKNTGDVSDNFSLSTSYSSGSANVTVRGADGAALSQPFTLAPQASTNVQVCYTPTMTEGGKSLDATVTVKGARSTSDSTTDRIDRVETQLPVLKKTISKDGDSAWQSGGTVTTGDGLTYTLSVTNPYSTPLTNVSINDPLPADLTVTAGAPTSWTVASLAPGETRDYTIHTTVAATSKDNEMLENTFTVTTKEIPQTLKSNTVVAYVWNSVPVIKKAASTDSVTFGDQLQYTLTLQNVSEASAMVNVLVTDSPAKGLQYVPGSAKIDGKPLTDPTITGNSMAWRVDRIEAKSQRLLTYNMRVTPEAAGNLENSVIMEGFGANGRTRAVASSRAFAQVVLKLLNFAPQADILGTVFVDYDGNGKQNQDDLPLSGARVILAGGRISQTDARGRFHFGNVALGTQALRLDPASVPYQSEAGSPATRSVYVNGLTSVDFALKPNAGVVGRTISFSQGDLNTSKTVSRIAGGYQVQLNIDSPRPLTAFSLQDTLPQGAVLRSGQNSYAGPLAAGRTTLNYTYSVSGNPTSVPADLFTAPTISEGK